MYKADIETWNCKITKNEIKILHLYYPHSIIKIQLTLLYFAYCTSWIK